MDDDMKIEKSPSMPFYGKDAYTDEAFLNLSFGGQGFFVFLAWWQWLEGDIPLDFEEILDRVSRRHTAEAKRLWASVEPLFPPSTDNPHRRRNETTEGHRLNMLARRGRQQYGADLTNAKRTPKSVSLSGTQSTETAIATAMSLEESIEFIQRQFEIQPTREIVISWIARIGSPRVCGVLADYPNKPVAYIEKCIETSEQRNARDDNRSGERKTSGTAAQPKHRTRDFGQRNAVDLLRPVPPLPDKATG